MIDENYFQEYSNNKFRDISDTTNNTNITANKSGVNYDLPKRRSEVRKDI